MKIDFTCSWCGRQASREACAVNRSRKIGAPLYCSLSCAGIARRKGKATEQKKAEKAEYDQWYRGINYRKLKKQKAEHYARTKNREKERIIRQKRMPQHVEYCRQPAYKAKKKVYDLKRRAAAFGEFAEAYLATLEINREVKERMDRYEIYKEQGRLNKSTRRKRAAAAGSIAVG